MTLRKFTARLHSISIFSLFAILVTTQAEVSSSVYVSPYSGQHDKFSPLQNNQFVMKPSITDQSDYVVEDESENKKPKKLDYKINLNINFKQVEFNSKDRKTYGITDFKARNGMFLVYSEGGSQSHKILMVEKPSVISSIIEPSNDDRLTCLKDPLKLLVKNDFPELFIIGEKDQRIGITLLLNDLYTYPGDISIINSTNKYNLFSGSPQDNTQNFLKNSIFTTFKNDEAFFAAGVAELNSVITTTKSKIKSYKEPSNCFLCPPPCSMQNFWMIQ